MRFASNFGTLSSRRQLARSEVLRTVLSPYQERMVRLSESLAPFPLVVRSACLAIPMVGIAFFPYVLVGSLGLVHVGLLALVFYLFWTPFMMVSDMREMDRGWKEALMGGVPPEVSARRLSEYQPRSLDLRWLAAAVPVGTLYFFGAVVIVLSILDRQRGGIGGTASGVLMGAALAGCGEALRRVAWPGPREPDPRSLVRPFDRPTGTDRRSSPAPASESGQVP